MLQALIPADDNTLYRIACDTWRDDRPPAVATKDGASEQARAALAELISRLIVKLRACIAKRCRRYPDARLKSGRVILSHAEQLYERIKRQPGISYQLLREQPPKRSRDALSAQLRKLIRIGAIVGQPDMAQVAKRPDCDCSALKWAQFEESLIDAYTYWPTVGDYDVNPLLVVPDDEADDILHDTILVLLKSAKAGGMVYDRKTKKMTAIENVAKYLFGTTKHIVKSDTRKRTRCSDFLLHRFIPSELLDDALGHYATSGSIHWESRVGLSVPVACLTGCYFVEVYDYVVQVFERGLYVESREWSERGVSIALGQFRASTPGNSSVAKAINQSLPQVLEIAVGNQQEKADSIDDCGPKAWDEQARLENRLDWQETLAKLPTDEQVVLIAALEDARFKIKVTDSKLMHLCKDYFFNTVDFTIADIARATGLKRDKCRRLLDNALERVRELAPGMLETAIESRAHRYLGYFSQKKGQREYSPPSSSSECSCGKPSQCKCAESNRLPICNCGKIVRHAGVQLCEDCEVERQLDRERLVAGTKAVAKNVGGNVKVAPLADIDCYEPSRPSHSGLVNGQGVLWRMTEDGRNAYDLFVDKPHGITGPHWAGAQRPSALRPTSPNQSAAVPCEPTPPTAAPEPAALSVPGQIHRLDPQSASPVAKPRYLAARSAEPAAYQAEF